MKEEFFAKPFPSKGDHIGYSGLVVQLQGGQDATAGRCCQAGGGVEGANGGGGGAGVGAGEAYQELTCKGLKSLWISKPSSNVPFLPFGRVGGVGVAQGFFYVGGLPLNHQ